MLIIQRIFVESDFDKHDPCIWKLKLPEGKKGQQGMAVVTSPFLLFIDSVNLYQTISRWQGLC